MKRTRRALDRLDDDIRDHIERETQDNLDRGMAPEEARRRAMLKFGNVALTKEATHAVWRWQWLEQLVRDSRYAIRIRHLSAASHRITTSVRWKHRLRNWQRRSAVRLSRPMGQDKEPPHYAGA